MISKPVVPPWDDSAKNIVRSQVRQGNRYAYRVLTVPGAPPPAPGVVCEPIYKAGGSYSPSLAQNLKVMLRGLRSRGALIHHYFFAPNPLSSTAGRIQRIVAGVKTVQTVCSAPESFDRIGRLLFTDRVVVLSRDTERKMLAAGVDAGRLRMIRPGIEPIERPDDERRRATREAFGIGPGPLIVFPGDYEFSNAADTVVEAAPSIVAGHAGATLVFACRIKREASREIRDRLRDKTIEAGLGDRVLFVEQVPDMPALVGAADAVVMPAESLYAKMDAPLVLLEAMSQGVPLVLASTPPLDEIIALEAALGVSPGDAGALADASLRILSEPDTARALGAAGRRAIAEKFSAAVMAREVEDLYDELLAAS
jgi:glycosyltransferase involved in cell wall biosynthesis